MLPPPIPFTLKNKPSNRTMSDSNRFIVPEELSLKEAWEEVHAELRRAATDRNHPFRNMQLATTDHKSVPQQRIVILRRVDDDLGIYFYTDNRSDKIMEMHDNPSVSLLMWHPGKRLQLRIAGEATQVQDEALIAKCWEEGGKQGIRSYTTTLPPGTPVTAREQAYDWKESGTEHFTVVRIRIKELEFLQLDGDHHRRARRSYSGNCYDFVDTWLIP